MDDKNQTNTPPVTPTPEAPSAGGINFDQLLISNKQPEPTPAPEVLHEEAAVVVPMPSAEAQPSDLAGKPAEQGSTLLQEANAALREEAETSAVDISNIAIQEVTNEEVKESGQPLGVSGIGAAMLGKIGAFNYRKIVSISIVVIVVFSLVSGFAFLRKSYLDIASQPVIDPAYQTYIDYAKDYQKLWSDYTNLNDYSIMATTSFAGASAAVNVDAVLNSSRLSYVQKKDIFQNGLQDIARDIIANSNALDALKKEITQYGFFPKDLLAIFGEGQEDISIKKSLISLEIVKFSTAIKVFSYLDTFIKGLANLLSIAPEDVQKKIQDLDTRGERDIKTYLNTCYLNPYEIDENCNLIDDFSKYYTYYERSSVFDTSFFKKLMYYIDLKLEQSDLPNFSITFQRFDPRQKEISFNVTVDTFKQDEASLIRQGILNPHIFVVTQLLDLLKQSLFVIGEKIDAKQLKIQPKVIQIGSTVFPANSSSMNFVLPIQKNPQREIADFILNKDYYFAEPTSEQVAATGEQEIPQHGSAELVPQDLGPVEEETIVESTGEMIASTGEVVTGEIGTVEAPTVGIIP